MTEITERELIVEARNASLEDMLDILKTQRARRLDLVVPAAGLRFTEAMLELRGLDRIQSFEDVDGIKMLLDDYDPNGLYRPTAVFDEHIAERMDIPLRYVRRLRASRPDLYDLNVNGLIKGRNAKVRVATAEEIEALEYDFVDGPIAYKELRPEVAGDARRFFLRLFRGDGEGVARALMSNRFAPFDNLDGLTALMTGLQQAGVDPDGLSFDRLDLTERGMYVRVAVPEIATVAPELCKGYRNPFADGVERAGSLVRGREIDDWRQIAREEGMGYTEEEGGEPVVFMGVRFTNSEVGNGAFSVTPEVIVQVCKNGLTINAAKVATRHVGGRLEEGVHWAADTQSANLDLVVKQTRDLVAQWLSPEYLQQQVDVIEEMAGAKLTKPAEQVKVIGKKVGFTDEQVEGIFNLFVRGGQSTAGGLANAITAYSQTVVNPDVAQQLDSKAMEAMALAARS